jgi:hypothetical protein
VHQVTGNWVNNGTLTGSTSTIILNGSGISLSGTGLYVFNNVSIIASNNLASTDITVAGNLSTTGSGSFSMASGKTLTLSGTSKTITGTGFTFDNLLLSGSITSATSFMVNGNITVTGSLAASDGTITMSGTGKTISGSGAIGLYGLRVSGAVTTTTASLSVNAAMDVSGSFNATSPSTVTFTGASTLNGTANLYNVTLNGTSLQLSTDAVLGIANTYTITAGTLNVSASTPNTVNFNGTTAQSIPGSTYHNLVFSNGNTKTAAGAITINGNVQIASGTTFNAGTFSHAVQGNWVNAGTFTAGTSTINFTGIADATITGATTFSTLTVSKAAAGNKLTLLNNITVATLNMTSHANGFMQTGSNKVTITNTRTGTGIIIGTIQRTHAFTTGTAYAFEGPDNSITFFCRIRCKFGYSKCNPWKHW